jgi:hypothetical protein
VSRIPVAIWCNSREADLRSLTPETQTRHDGISHLKGSSVILIPQPANDPNDPLRWTLWRKYVAFVSVCAFSFLTNVSIGGLSPAFYILSLEFNKSTTAAAGLLTWCILVLGLGVSPSSPEILQSGRLMQFRTSFGCRRRFSLGNGRCSSSHACSCVCATFGPRQPNLLAHCSAPASLLPLLELPLKH